MDLHHLRCFIAVADERHFGRAADRLHLTVSPVSRAIKELEYQLDEQLFVRSHHSVDLSPRGVALLPQVVDIVMRFDALMRDSRRSIADQRQVLRLGASSLILSEAVDTTADAAQRGCPDATVVTHMALSDELIGMLKRDELDLAIIHLPAGVPGIQTHFLTRYTFTVAMGRNHPLASRRSLAISDIAPYPLLLSGIGGQSTISSWFSAHLRSAGLSRVRILAHEDSLGIAGRLAHSDAISVVPMESMMARTTFITERYRLVPLEEALEMGFGLAWTDTGVQRCHPLSVVLDRLVTGASEAVPEATA